MLMYGLKKVKITSARDVRAVAQFTALTGQTSMASELAGGVMNALIMQQYAQFKEKLTVIKLLKT